MSKEQLRQQFLRNRQRLTAKQCSEYSAVIAQRLFHMPAFQQAGVVMFYLSVPLEVATDMMIQTALDAGKQVVVPHCMDKIGEMEAVRLDDLRQVLTGRYGIRTPSRLQLVNKHVIEVMIVPAVGFDRHGNRIGHGAGYYDRFLADLPGVVKIGLAFAAQITEQAINAGPLDIAVDYVLTEDEVITVK